MRIKLRVHVWIVGVCFVNTMFGGAFIEVIEYEENLNGNIRATC